MYNIALTRVFVIIVAVEKAISMTYSECVCSLSYLECNAHVP